MKHNSTKITNIKRKSLLMVMCVMCYGIIYSQTDIQLNTYWQNPYYITPAYFNDVKSVVITAAARQQWVNFNGAPRTFFVSASSYFEDHNTQLGLRLFHDKAGITSNTDLALTYAYNLNYNYYWRINIGIAGSFQRLDYDLSNLSFEGANESNLYTSLRSHTNFNMDLGAEIYNQNFRIGVAGRNLISLFQTEKQINVNTNYLYGIYRHYSMNSVNMGGGLFAIQYGNRYFFEGNITAYFQSMDSEIFHTGISYRTTKQLGAILGVNVNSYMDISYNYNYNFGIASGRLRQTHEIMLTYKIDPKPVFRWDIE